MPEADDARLCHQSGVVEVVKPAVDKLTYRCLKLDNGLRITLVSDSEADKAAAAMDVSKLVSLMSSNIHAATIFRVRWLCTAVERVIDVLGQPVYTQA